MHYTAKYTFFSVQISWVAGQFQEKECEKSPRHSANSSLRNAVLGPSHGGDMAGSVRAVAVYGVRAWVRARMTAGHFWFGQLSNAEKGETEILI